MSEWEEFCDRQGMNAGSEEDYSLMINDLDDPSDASFTSKRPKVPTQEIEPTLGRDELVACLVRGVAEGGVEVHLNTTYFIEGQYEWNVLDGLAAPQFGFYLRLRPGSAQSDFYEHDVPISLLIEALCKGGVPLISDEGWWVAWDSCERCLKVSPSALEFHWRRALAAKPIGSMDERELDLMRSLYRAILSTDHGKKPLLIQREELDDALGRREVGFDTPRRIALENLERFALAFYDAGGGPQALSLKRVAELGFPISTRRGTYVPTAGDLVPYLSEAQLVAGAFLIATESNPNELRWFLARDRGSIFESAIEQIEGPKVNDASREVIGSVQWRDSDRQTYLASSPPDALDNAKSINEWADELGTVYITADWHPLDSGAVTTPELYERAITILNRCGYQLSYSWIGKVKIEKASGATGMTGN